MEIELKIEEVLRQLGLTGPFDQDEYVAHMTRSYSPYAVRFMDAVDTAHAAGFSQARWNRLYELKNKHAEMSRYVSAHEYTSIYRSVLQWLTKSVDVRLRSIVDLGCENGLLTLCLASMYPEATVVGIDRIPAALRTARSFTMDGYEDRVSFALADISRIGSLAKVDPAELVVASLVLHEVLDLPDSAKYRAGAGLAHLVEQGGSLITINRFPRPAEQIPRLSEVLALGGLALVAEDEVLSGAESFPVGVYRHIP
jgi:SAM-dependent methyltransferase